MRFLQTKCRLFLFGIVVTICPYVLCQDQSRILVPRIEQDNYQLQPEGQRYKLVISLPDGSERIENAELRSPGTSEEELHLIGTITENFPEAVAITMYEAGVNGYTVKYKYESIPLPPVGGLGISPAGLKSAAG